MAEAPVANASPLILLSKGGCLDLLCAAGDRIVTPAAVIAEIERRGPSDRTVRAIRGASWLRVVEDPPPDSVILAWDLGLGESAVLAWAKAHPGSRAICDDLAARRCAKTLGIPVRGTVGIVLLAKQRGLIPAARPVIERIVRSGMYLSDRAISDALALVGE